MESSRRSFIKNSALAATAITLIPTNIFASPRPDNKLVLQLYAVDKEMHFDTVSTLAAIHKIGYRFIEHAGYGGRKFYGYSATEFGKLVKESGLVLLSGHTVLEKKHWNPANRKFINEWHETIEDAVIAGQSYLITPWLDAGCMSNDKELKQFTEVLNRSGELCANAGIKFGYHNHDFEFTNFINGRSVYDIILQYTDSRFVTMQLDTGNILPGSGSAISVLKKYPSRFKMIHIKDVIATDDRHHKYQSTVIGTGINNVNSIIDAAREFAGVSSFVVDHHPQTQLDAMSCARSNYIAMEHLFKTC